jgi:hypothetical protein
MLPVTDVKRYQERNQTFPCKHPRYAGVYIWVVDSAVCTESTRDVTLQEVMLQNPHDEYTDLGMSSRLAVEQLNQGKIVL